MRQSATNIQAKKNLAINMQNLDISEVSGGRYWIVNIRNKTHATDLIFI